MTDNPNRKVVPYTTQITASRWLAFSVLITAQQITRRWSKLSAAYSRGYTGIYSPKLDLATDAEYAEILDASLRAIGGNERRDIDYVDHLTSTGLTPWCRQCIGVIHWWTGGWRVLQNLECLRTWSMVDQSLSVSVCQSAGGDEMVKTIYVKKSMAFKMVYDKFESYTATLWCFLHARRSHASAVLGVVILSVRLSVRPSVTRVLCD